jgi:hypothetical protein
MEPVTLPQLGDHPVGLLVALHLRDSLMFLWIKGFPYAGRGFMNLQERA